MARKGLYSSTYYDADDVRRWAYGHTPEEAKTNAAVKEALSKANVREIKSTMSVSEWADTWLISYKEGVVGKKWYNQMKALIADHINPEIGTMRIRGVKPMHIQSLMNQHKDKSVSFQKKLLLILSQIFDSAEENSLIDKSPVKRIKVSVNGSERRTRPITDRERALTLKVADEHLTEGGMFFLLMLFCGCRPQEVSRLKMCDYDRDQKILSVRRARKSDGSTGKPKSAAGIRDIPVPDYLAERLEKLDKEPNDYIVTALCGSPLTATSEQNVWHRFKRWMDIENGAEVFRNAIIKSTIAEDLVPYDYRHTYCTDLQDAGVPVTVAKVLMGHSSISVTADIYTHRTADSIEDARAKINTKISGRSDKQSEQSGTNCGTKPCNP